MVNFRTRRLIGLLTILVVSAGFLAWVRHRQQRLTDVNFFTGYILLGIVLFLVAFHWRKKLTPLPLGSASLWLQLHIYAGLFSSVVSLSHVGWHWPTGWLNSLLFLLYLSVFSSGVFGLYITRTYPRRLTHASEQFVFERIPARRHQLQQSARELVLQAVGTHGTITLADFYQQHLGNYFERSRSLIFFVRPSTMVKRKLMADLVSIQRYLSDDERRACDQLFHLIRKKDDLDYHFALQLMLKLWLFVHLALSYSLLLVLAVHVLVVHAFHGGWQ